MINLLAASKALQVFIPALILLVLAMLFAIALAYLGKKLAVSRDERIDRVKDCLSGANCGACGYAGCDGFATALVEGKAELSSCNATSKEKKEEIAEILGFENVTYFSHFFKKHTGLSPKDYKDKTEHNQK